MAFFLEDPRLEREVSPNHVAFLISLYLERFHDNDVAFLHPNLVLQFPWDAAHPFLAVLASDLHPRAAHEAQHNSEHFAFAGESQAPALLVPAQRRGSCPRFLLVLAEISPEDQYLTSGAALTLSLSSRRSSRRRAGVCRGPLPLYGCPGGCIPCR